MLLVRIKGRCPSARLLGVAQLPGYELRWHKSGADGSGKCDVISVGSDHAVFGVVYELDANEKAALDQAEGLGQGYDQKDIRVFLNGDAVTVSMYFATNTEPALKPYTWYKAIVIAGAKEHDLPAPYIASLEAADASEDPDRTRHEGNMRIVTAADGMDVVRA
jgi:gamma-glutamylcyclotransferase